MRQFLGNPWEELENGDEFDELTEDIQANFETGALGHNFDVDLVFNPPDSLNGDLDNNDLDDDDDLDNSNLDDNFDAVCDDIDDGTSDESVDPDYIMEEEDYSGGSNLNFGVDESYDSDIEGYDSVDDFMQSDRESDYISYEDGDEEHPPATLDPASKAPIILSSSDSDSDERDLPPLIPNEEEENVHPPVAADATSKVHYPGFSSDSDDDW